ALEAEPRFVHSRGRGLSRSAFGAVLRTQTKRTPFKGGGDRHRPRPRDPRHGRGASPSRPRGRHALPSSAEGRPRGRGRTRPLRVRGPRRSERGGRELGGHHGGGGASSEAPGAGPGWTPGRRRPGGSLPREVGHEGFTGPPRTVRPPRRKPRGGYPPRRARRGGGAARGVPTTLPRKGPHAQRIGSLPGPIPRGGRRDPGVGGSSPGAPCEAASLARRAVSYRAPGDRFSRTNQSASHAKNTSAIRPAQSPLV